MDSKLKEMYNHFNLSDDEELSYSEQILPEGFKVCISLPERITNEEIAEYFYNTLPYTFIIGMNESVGYVVIPVETVNWQCINVCFNRC